MFSSVSLKRTVTKKRAFLYNVINNDHYLQPLQQTNRFCFCLEDISSKVFGTVVCTGVSEVCMICVFLNKNQFV